MLFRAGNTWWGNHGIRVRPHEGLDIGLYVDRQRKIRCLDAKTDIPACYDGIIVKVFNDFIGESMLIEHTFSAHPHVTFYTIYGHLNRNDACHAGQSVREGDIIGTLAEPDDSKTDILPHLHLSLGWSPEKISYASIDWKHLCTASTLILLDPLLIMNRHDIAFDQGEPSNPVDVGPGKRIPAK
jgi:murein DD-endopeptidase MepM/ murein hydrolase activator NlpD